MALSRFDGFSSVKWMMEDRDSGKFVITLNYYSGKQAQYLLIQ